MEEKKPNELNDEALDQVAGGSGGDDDDCRRTVTIGGRKIRNQSDLRYLCYRVLAKKGRNEVIGILMRASPASMALVCVEQYRRGGLDALFDSIDRYL